MTDDPRLLARRMRNAGADWDETFQRLREDGATIIDCLKIVREIDEVDLGRAKEIVDSSFTWADRFASSDKLRETAIEAIESDRNSP